MGFFLTEDKPKRKAALPKGSRPSSGKSPRKQSTFFPTIPLIEDRSGLCQNCTLLAVPNQNPQMVPTGSEKPWLYVLGEAPGADEDDQGEQFVGKAGRTIRDPIPVSLAKNVRWNNACRCRPPDNRTPTALEMRQCSRLQIEDIERTKPPLVLVLGNTPLEWALGEAKISQWRGLFVSAQIGTHKCFVVPAFHPSYINRKKNDKKEGQATEDLFLSDLQNVFDFALANKYQPARTDIVTLEEMSRGLDWVKEWTVDEVEHKLNLLRAKVAPVQGFDYETTGFRPYGKDDNIVSAAFGTWDYSLAIPLHHAESKWTPKQLKQVKELIKKHLRDRGISFVAHNLAFEQEWTAVKLDPALLHEVNWEDTMAQAWTLNNTRPMSLDARTLMYLGVRTKSLDTLDKSRMFHEPIEAVLKYNARDSKVTHRVWQCQWEDIQYEGLEKAYREYIDRHPAIILAQVAGVIPDTDCADAKHEELQGRIKAIEKKIQAQKVVKDLVVQQGKPFNVNSNPQLVTIFKDMLKAKEGWRQEKGVKKYSTDEEALSQMRHPLAKLIIEHRKVLKMDSTYVVGFMSKEEGNADRGKHIHADGLVHTKYNILIARTGRLSSEDPNLQNQPIRTEEGRRLRNSIVAPEGYLMVSVDMGQIEARIIAMASRDTNLVESMWEGSDIHMVWTDKLIKEFGKMCLDKYIEEGEDNERETLRKRFRQDMKNMWTFPLFFGSEVNAVANDLELPVARLSPYVEEFWEMFPGVLEWQRRMVNLYHERGYAETLTGRRRYGPLSNEAAINSPIQGTATDVLLDSMKQLSFRAYKENRPALQPVLNIHDDLTFYLPREDVADDLEIIVPTMCCPRYDFVNVPITVEVKIGERWGELEEVFKATSTEYGFPERARDPMAHKIQAASTGERSRPRINRGEPKTVNTRPRILVPRPIRSR